MKYIASVLSIIVILSVLTVGPITFSDYAASAIESRKSASEITVTVDKAVYVRGEKIRIAGTAPKVSEGLQIFLDIVDPSHTYCLGGLCPSSMGWMTTPNPDGTYEYEIRVEDALFGIPTRCVDKKIYTLEATYTINQVPSGIKAQTTFEIETVEHTPYAEKSRIANFPSWFWKEDRLEYNVLEYVFFDEAPCRFMAIFQVIDSGGFVTYIKPMPINTSNSHIITYSDSSYDPPILGVELGTSYFDEIYVFSVGNYTLQIFSWTDLERPIPLADVIEFPFTVVERTSTVKRGNITLTIATTQSNYGARQNATIFLDIINDGNLNLTLTNNNQNPLNITLYAYEDGNYSSPRMESACILYDDPGGREFPISSNTLRVDARSSLHLRCEYFFNPVNYPDPLAVRLHLRAIGKVIGLERWDENTYGEKPTEAGSAILSTNYIDFFKDIKEFEPYPYG